MGRRPGFYERRIFPWLNEKLTSGPELTRMRSNVLAAARGRVLEIGFGSGASLLQYPSSVESIIAIEPNEGMRRLARKRETSRAPLVLIGGAAEQIPIASESIDTAVSVLTLCSVLDPARALSELWRVLRADGALLLLEHGLAEEPNVVRWQHRLNPIQNVLACGCHLNRPIAALVERHGFDSSELQRSFVPGIPKTHGWMTAGTARKADRGSGQELRGPLRASRASAS